MAKDSFQWHDLSQASIFAECFRENSEILLYSRILIDRYFK